MNTLRIPIASISDGGYLFEEHVCVSSIQPSDTKALPVENVLVSGNFDRLGDEFLFRGHISGSYEGACVRCLAPSLSPFDIEVAWVFAEGPAAVFEEVGHALDRAEGDVLSDDSKDTRRAFQGHDLNLAPYVWEEVVFAQPSQYLCRDDCSGLCPHCGMNKNDGVCRCVDDTNKEEIGNHGLAGLAKLFPELVPEKTKE